MLVAVGAMVVVVVVLMSYSRTCGMRCDKGISEAIWVYVICLVVFCIRICICGVSRAVQGEYPKHLLFGLPIAYAVNLEMARRI